MMNYISVGFHLIWRHMGTKMESLFVIHPLEGCCLGFIRLACQKISFFFLSSVHVCCSLISLHNSNTTEHNIVSRALQFTPSQPSYAALHCISFVFKIHFKHDFSSLSILYFDF